MKTSFGKILGLIAFIVSVSAQIAGLAYFMCLIEIDAIQNVLGSLTIIFGIVWGAVGANRFAQKLNNKVDKQ